MVVQLRGVIRRDNMLYTTWLLALATLASGACAWQGPENSTWWQTGIIYQVYPRSFKDSNGDGIGDLKGIISKLPYVKSSGINAVWLSPIYPSPQADSGYDVANFTDVDRTYGTLQDFDNLVEEAHKAGLKVVLDFVPNHSSDEHPWFIASEDPKHPEHNKYKDYYVWANGKGWGGNSPPNNWISVFRGSAWTYSAKRKQYYLHQFHTKQPDLNYRNKAVVEEMKNVLRFWMDRKVDGFRIDAVPFLFEDTKLVDEPKSGNTDDKDDHGYLKHIYTQNLNETYDMIQQWRAVIDERKDQDRVMMAEVYAPIEETLKYYGTKERPGAHFPYNFYLITDLNRSSNSTDFKNTIDKWMTRMNDSRWPNWVIGNHDQKRVATRLGPELASSLNMISLSLPGTAITYNGEEIGMTDTFIRWEDSKDPQAINKGPKGYLEVSRDPCRTPMQWDNTISAGFSNSTSTWLPVNPNYWEVNVANEMTKHSPYTVYLQMAEARKSATMKKGDVKVTQNGDLLLIERTLQNEPSFLLVVNLGPRETTWTYPDLEKMKVFAGSLNSGVSPQQNTNKNLLLKPGAGYLLTVRSSSTITSASVLTIIGLCTLVFTYTKNLFST